MNRDSCEVSAVKFVRQSLRCVIDQTLHVRQVLSVATMVMHAHRGASAVVRHVLWSAHDGVMTNAGTFLASQWPKFYSDPRARRVRFSGNQI